jgi:hypothetical protein
MKNKGVPNPQFHKMVDAIAAADDLVGKSDVEIREAIGGPDFMWSCCVRNICASTIPRGRARFRVSFGYAEIGGTTGVGLGVRPLAQIIRTMNDASLCAHLLHRTSIGRRKLFQRTACAKGGGEEGHASATGHGLRRLCTNLIRVAATNNG